MKKKLTILLWACLPVVFLVAQPAQINVRKIGNENGLITTNITDLLQDSKGFLWVINFDKIQRYDGKYTKQFYTHEQGNKHITGIAEDRTGTIWLATAKYLYKYENEYDGFKGSADTSNPAGQQLKMIANEYNQVFILCRNGILTIDEKSNTLKKLPVNFTSDNNSYHPFYSFKNSLFFSNTKKIYRYQLPLGQFDSIPFANARQMAVLNEDSIWAGSTGLTSSLMSFPAKTVLPVAAVQFDKIFTSPVFYISETYPVSNTFFFTVVRYKGFYLYNKKDNHFKEIKVYENGVELQNDEVTFNGFTKAKNGVDFLLLSKGLFYIIPENRSFNFFNPAGVNPSNEGSSVIRDFAEGNDKNIWMATSNGFVKWNRLSGQLKNYYPKPEAKDYLNFASVRGIAFNKNKLLIGQSQGGIWVFDPVTEKFTRPLYPPGTYGDSVKRWAEKDFISSISPLKNGNYLVAGLNFIKIIHGSDNRVDFVNFIGIKNIRSTRQIYEDKQGRLWFIGAEIYVTDSSFRLLAHIANPALNPSYLNAIIQVTDSTFWIGWEGMHEVTVTKNGSLTMLPIFNRLGKQVIYNLYQDTAGFVWATSEDGIYRLQSDKKSYRLYDQNNNVLSKQFSFARIFRSNDGNIYFPGYNGVTYYTPEKLSGTEDSLYTIITSVKVNNNDSLFFLNRAGNLQYNQNSIEINYIAPYVYNGTKVMYRYFLEGADKDWVNTGNNTFVRFSSLAHGDYKFRVAASLNGNDWFETAQPFSFTISPPFWKTWWFRAGLILFVIGFIFLFVRKRINKIKAKAAIKQQMTELEVKALRAQMNPHFIFNAMNSIQQFTLKNDIDNASLYISKFSTLLRKVLHSSHQNFITLSEEIEQLNLYLAIEKLRMGDPFTFRVLVDDEIETDAVKMPGMIVQPFVENAVKHGLLLKEGDKNLVIQFHLINENKLRVTISDNGIGRQKALEIKKQQEKLLPYESKGIKLVMERLQLLSKEKNTADIIHFEDLQDEAGTPSGTIVRISIPLQLF